MFSPWSALFFPLVPSLSMVSTWFVQLCFSVRANDHLIGRCTSHYSAVVPIHMEDMLVKSEKELLYIDSTVFMFNRRERCV